MDRGSNRSGIGKNVMSGQKIRLLFVGIDPPDKEDKLSFRDRVVRVGKFDPATDRQLTT